MTIQIRRATGNDLPGAKSLLADAGLPVGDLQAEYVAYVAAADENVVGVIGCEARGRIGLLRSLVIADSARTHGLGRKLVAALEASVREQGMDELWLLTIDADAYFARLGYEVRSRESAPDAIRGTAEFTELCPGDSVLMFKLLG